MYRLYIIYIQCIYNVCIDNVDNVYIIVYNVYIDNVDRLYR